MSTSQAETAKKFDTLYNDIMTIEGLIEAVQLIADDNTALLENTPQNIAFSGLMRVLPGMAKRCSRLAAELHDDLDEPCGKEASAA